VRPLLTPISLGVLLALAGAAAPSALGQTGSKVEAAPGGEGFVRPEAARRLVRLWDFEERPGNVEPVPREWARNQHNPPEAPRPGFPAWNLAAFDDTIAHSGQTSVMLPTRGGSTALSLIRGVLPSMPGGRYAVSAYIRTQGLLHARAVVRVRMLDNKMNPIGAVGAEGASEPIVTNGEWVKVQTLLEGNEDGAWMQVDLELLQPSELNRAALPKYEIPLQDYSGAAWFDDVRVEQVPRVELTSAAAAGVAVSPEKPELRLRVQDLTGEQLSVRVEVEDIDGMPVDSLETPVESGGRQLAWAPVLPAFGWYRATMTVLGPTGQGVARLTTDFAWAPPLRPSDRLLRRSWGVVAEELEARRVPMLPDLLELTATGGVSLSVWSNVGRGELDLGDKRTREEIDTTVNRLVERRQDITFVLGHAPEAMAREARVDPDDPIEILAGDNDVWMPGVSSLLSRFGERVTRWQVGPTGSERAFWRPNLSRDLRAVERGFRGLVPRPTMTSPWRIEQGIEAARGVDALTVVVPGNVPAEGIPLYSSLWTAMANSGSVAGSTATLPEVTLVLQRPDPEVFGERESVEELVRRGAMAWASGVPRASVDLPFEFNEGAASRAVPTPAFPAWRTLVSHLSGREFAGNLPIATGVTALLARSEGTTGSGGGGGALIAWNSHALTSDAVVSGYLGTGNVTITDVFGNTRPSAPDEGGRHRIVLSQSPVFIEGVDVNLLRLRAGVHLSPASLPARAERHTLNVVIENPWGGPVSGALRLAEPVEWEMSPRVIPFVLQSGQSRSYPFTVSLGVGEASGQRIIHAELDITSDRRYPTLKLELPLELGLETIQMQPSFRYLTGRDGTLSDLMVSMLVTNLDSQPVTLECFVQAPGQRSQQAPISALAPGESAIRQFHFAGAAKALRGKKILAGLKEVSGTGRLNKIVEIQ
jgi:hypothetical protein